jgi:hypothetical protein
LVYYFLIAPKELRRNNVPPLGGQKAAWTEGDAAKQAGNFVAVPKATAILKGKNPNVEGQK